MPSKIIKGDDLDPMPERPAVRASRPGVIDAEVFDARQQAKDIVEQARREAAAIKEAAQKEKDGVLAAARDAGRQEGLAQATEVVLRAKQEYAAVLAASEPEIVKLSLLIAEKIIGHQLENDPDVVLSIVAQAIESVRQQRELVLRVNPEDAKLLREGRKKLMDMLGRTKDIAVRDDPEVARGGCIIETEHGTVEAELKTQLKMLEVALLGERKT